MSLRRLSKLRRFGRFTILSLILAAAVTVWTKVGPLLHGSSFPAVPATAGETFTFLRECHRNRAYGAMRPHIHPSGREGVIDLLISVDELRLANSAVLAAMKRVCPEVETERYDLVGVIQDRLELFSREVELVDVREDGEKATLTVEISRRLPLERLEFEGYGGVWQYLPGPENLAVLQAIRQLSRTLHQIELALSSRDWTAEQIDREFRIRIRPRLRLLKQQAATSQPA
jgi:hypothetical protein